MAIGTVLSAVRHAAVSIASSIKSQLMKPLELPRTEDWIADVKAVDLTEFAADVGSARDHEDYVWVMRHRAQVLTDVRALLQDGAKLLEHNGTSQSEDARKVRAAYARLRRARRDALQPILDQIEHTLPAVEGRLRQFPIDASLLAYGFMTLVGFVWLCGYYTAFEIEVVPLLRDIRDVFLIGATSGLMPVAIFAGLTAAAFRPFVRIRRIARLDTATREQVLTALEEARLLRSVGYWWLRCVLGLVVVANVSVLAGLYRQAHSTYDIAVIGDTSREEPMRVMGSIGGFLVTAPVDSSAPGITIVPIDDVKCLQRGNGTGACERPNDDADDDGAEDLATTISTALAVLRERDEWHTFVERAGQCRVVRTANPSYFFSPLFKDKDGELNEGQTKSLIRNNEGTLRGMIAAAGNGPRATINIIGFASGTASPARNSQLAAKRAQTVADALIRGIPTLRSCKVSPPAEGEDDPPRAETCPITIRAWGYGELPPLSWLGKQGDPSERVVMIAACSEDIR
jgi:hypothetical protein